MGPQPIIEVKRGGQIESLHYGSIAVCDPDGNLLASWGDAQLATFTRSTAKPFQAYPLVAAKGLEHFGLSDRELAIACASHSGTDLHAETVAGILEKIGLNQSDLRCGTHKPYDRATARRIRAGELEPSPLRHNCSGKHAGMLALANLRGQDVRSYLELDGMVQQEILASIARMTDLETKAIMIGMDGCSAPNFAVPLHAGARAFAMLARAGGEPDFDPIGHRIYRAMTAHPEMVSGPGRFDTRLMEVGEGRILVKGGAEGCYGMALLAERGDQDGLALGVMIKISDGDTSGRAMRPVVLDTLRQLARLRPNELEQLAEFAARPIKNHRGLVVGEIRSTFELHWGSAPRAR